MYMSETAPENTTSPEFTEDQLDSEVRAKIIADGVPETEITHELIAERIEIDGKLADTAMISGETVEAWRRRLLTEAENSETWWTEWWILDQAQQVATKAAREAKDWVSWAVQDAVENIPDRIGDAAAEKVDGFLQGFLSKIPWMENFSLWDTVKKAVMWFFALLWLDKLLPNLFWEAEATTTPEPVVNPVTKVLVPPVVKPLVKAIKPQQNEIVDENLDTKRAAFYKSWANLIIGLNWALENWVANKDDILTWLRDLKYSEIQTLSIQQKEVLLWNEATSGEAELRDELLEKLLTSDTETLLRVWLSASSIWNIVKPNWVLNERLFLYFWDTAESWKTRLEEIYTLSQKDWFNWKDLSFWEISMLYISSIPALRIPAVAGVSDAFNNVRTFLSDEVLPDDVEDLYVIPRSVLKKFATHFNATTTNTHMDDSSVDSLIASLYSQEVVSPEDRVILESIFDTKEYLKSTFVNDEKLMLSDEQKRLFLHNLDYTWVLAIYAILWGANNLDSINPISLPVLLLAISNIVWQGGTSESYQWSLYLGNYMRKTLFSGNETGLSPDELDVLKIYGNSAFEFMILSHFESVAQTMWVPSGALWLNLAELWWATFVSGLAINRAWALVTRRWLNRGTVSFWGTFLRKIWLLWMFAGGLTGGASLLLEENPMTAFADDLEWAINDPDKENALRKFQEVLELHENSVHEYTLPTWESLVVSAYPWETPFVVINEKIYTLNIWARDLGWSLQENWERLWKGDYDNISSLIAGIVWLEKTSEINWVNFDIQAYSDWNIIFWEGDSTYTIALNDILQIQSWAPWLIGNDIAHRLTDGEYKIPWIGSEWEPGYIINTLWANHVLYLREIGSIS